LLSLLFYSLCNLFNFICHIVNGSIKCINDFATIFGLCFSVGRYIEPPLFYSLLSVCCEVFHAKLKIIKEYLQTFHILWSVIRTFFNHIKTIPKLIPIRYVFRLLNLMITWLWNHFRTATWFSTPRWLSIKHTWNFTRRRWLWIAWAMPTDWFERFQEMKDILNGTLFERWILLFSITFIWILNKIKMFLNLLI